MFGAHHGQADGRFYHFADDALQATRDLRRCICGRVRKEFEPPYPYL